MSQKRALVTGGAGFIGSNLATRLLQEGWEVTVVDDMSAGEWEFIPKAADKMLCDFASPAVLKAIREQNFDTVFHLAAKPRVAYSVEHPTETNDINVQRTVQLFEACKGNVGRVVNTSSSSVYGGADTLPTYEAYPHNPKSPYALQKSITEQYAMMFSDLYNMDIVSVRPFNVFGPNQKGDNPYACAVSAWLWAVKHGKPLRSDGTGEQTRDITYVDNVVDVFVKCANHPYRFHADAFNAGTEFSVSNNDVLAWFKKEYPDAKVVTAPWRPGDVMHTCASMKKAKGTLGWKPLVSFWEGLERTREWAMTNPLF